MVTGDGLNVKLITTAYDRESEVVCLLTDLGMFKLSKASAERLRNHLVEFLGPAGKDDLLLQAMENGGTYYSQETGHVNMSGNQEQS